MACNDRCVTIQPYFRVTDGDWDFVNAALDRFVEQAKTEPGCLYYGFTVNGDRFYCREGYVGSEGALAHLANIGPLLEELLASGKAELVELQIHGLADEIEPLREPLKDLNPTFWVLERGFNVRDEA